MKCSSNLSSSILDRWEEWLNRELTKLASAFSNSLKLFLACSISSFLREYGASEWKAAISRFVSGFESLTFGIFGGIVFDNPLFRQNAKSQANLNGIRNIFQRATYGLCMNQECYGLLVFMENPYFEL